ncbi:helix-turn-helix domain-containing protein [Natronococcus occultus]|uniref:Putative DNA binding protein n=1 Tax=Natronococcus occultus SP4 TaxID=694430 RepID=L0JWY4_9EURY|nr:helix-turn-helix domain-containing protein [Natronococcus occultus]AGB36795.1 putative DNA binding protein [Natronococcus occultus SP4]
MSGLSATVVLSDPENCPVARATSATGESIEDVSRSSPVGGEAPPVEEFSIGGEPTPLDDEVVGVELSRISSNEHGDVYRFDRPIDDACACELVEVEGTPVSSIRAEEGALYLTVRATDVETLSAIVGRLRERFDGVELQQLLRTGEDESADLALVDRSQLTDRQREVLETAHEMGYFEYPKRANAGDVAAAIGISRSTFSEHLGAAQTKLLDSILEA